MALDDDQRWPAQRQPVVTATVRPLSPDTVEPTRIRADSPIIVNRHFGTTPAATPTPLELVEGPTLADRIAQKAIPIDEALAISKQSVEAAHEQGIIHRDLNRPTSRSGQTGR